MSRIYGTIDIDFTTKGNVSDEDFTRFKKELSNLVDDLSDKIFDCADENGCSPGPDNVFAATLDTDGMRLTENN